VARSAAFFDLDRTLLLGGSGPDLADALREAGLQLGSASAVADVAFATYDVVGETIPSVFLSRHSIRKAKGWPVSKVRAAADVAAEVLEPKVERFARQTMDEHRRAGRLLVMATAAPFDLVEPLAQRLGFDDLLATRHRIAQHPDHGPVYAGELDGEFVWGRGKARSVEVWALAHDVELADSYAYTDSVFDIPLLKRVGHPVAVNPDPRLLAYASYKRWPRIWFNAPPGVPKPLGYEPQDLAVRLAQGRRLPWVHLETEGLQYVPAEGGALLVHDWKSRFDPYAIALAVQRVGRPLRMVDQRNAAGDEDRSPSGLARSFGFLSLSDSAAVTRALKAGELVAATDAELVGDVDVPVIHVRLEGTEAVWPVGARFPYLLNLAEPPTVRVAVNSPERVPAAA
jgi:putative phosphoserine phosphatase/1-acylglycerol-3-phosphate O-acyltransferase